MNKEMKASELIARLQKAIAKNGDLPVYVQGDEENGVSCGGVAVELDENDAPRVFLLSDVDTLDAFRDSGDTDDE